MRQVFSSARLENVEQVVKMLADAGIDTRITNGRSYKGAIRGNFSYRGDVPKQPAVWIVRSADQPRARAILREAGLMDSSRNAPDSYIATSFRGSDETRAVDGGRKRAFRIKVGLLLAIAAIVALAYTVYRPQSPTPAAGGSPAPPVAPSLATVPADLPGRGTKSTPDSLAVALLHGELPERAGDVACLAVDGDDASPALLAALPPTPGKVLPVSQCPAGTRTGTQAPQIIAIGKYVANDAGTGTIFMQRRRVGARGVPQWYDVRREGEGWRIIQPL